eukprot:Lithocolla_globosa_v1_NODE_880_length_3143_cov_5.921632.p3 type:complete len:198 gc:universal NODE_880_length_3143_cov_5.921632:2136-1543(-)
MMVDNPGSRRMISDAPFAASHAPATAIPTLATDSAGLSLTSSPVIATCFFICISDCTIVNLCSGNTPAKPSTRFKFCIRSSFFSTISGPWKLTPIFRRPAVSTAIASWSPVIILMSTPSSFALWMVSAESWRGGSKIENKPTNCHRPWGEVTCLVTATPNVRRPREAYCSICWSMDRPRPSWPDPLANGSATSIRIT